MKMYDCQSCQPIATDKGRQSFDALQFGSGFAVS